MGIKIESKSQRPKIEIRKTLLGYHTCSVCKEPFEITIDQKVIEQINVNPNTKMFYQMHLHGDPLHAIILYIDEHLTVRHQFPVENIEVVRDHNTFKSFTRLWSNSSHLHHF